MPELPEVETVVRGLRSYWEGSTLHTVDLRRPNLRWPFPQGFAKNLEGRTITRLHRRAKFILADLNDGHTLMIHLGMTGRLTHQRDNLATFAYTTEQQDKHNHVLFTFQDGGQTVYNDTRRFGFMDLFVKTHPMLENLGHEPLDEKFTPGALYECLHTRATPIKSALLDQKLVTGVGNIYACEALFQAHISPKTPSKQLTLEDVTRLHHAIQDVLKRAIAAGGSTLRDYVQSDGSLGYFQHTFLVYGRAGDPCAICSTPIETLRQNGRSTFFCPSCQA